MADPSFKELFELMSSDSFDIDIMKDEGKASADPALMATVDTGTDIDI